MSYASWHIKFNDTWLITRFVYRSATLCHTWLDLWVLRVCRYDRYCLPPRVVASDFGWRLTTADPCLRSPLAKGRLGEVKPPSSLSSPFSWGSPRPRSLMAAAIFKLLLLTFFCIKAAPSTFSGGDMLQANCRLRLPTATECLLRWLCELNCKKRTGFYIHLIRTGVRVFSVFQES